MPSDDFGLSRRDFIKLSAASAAATGAWYSTSMKTDALGNLFAAPGEDDIIPYLYHPEDP